ncbi:PREDICTED: uncharacterized protein LOC109295512 [Gavialis gangeticus]|uniref:uncharacterized protein LOC109295512 n=1 Tax=Gavialis gangeticus TaxID=94835 RepID=UPI00092F3C97|nr:PREDICTED: uncharacterized protein LOC109295512 [Gavialis gangeticus]
MSRGMRPPDPIRRTSNWSCGEVLDLIAIWGEEMRTVAITAKGTKRNRQNQAVCERIAVQMVAWGHQRDWLQVRTKLKSLKSLYVRSRNTNRVPRAARSPIPFHKELADILEWDRAVAPHRTAAGLVCCDKQEEESCEAASSQQPPAAPQESSEDPVSPGTIFLSPITEPGTQKTRKVDPGQDGGSSNDTDIEHPAENLSRNPTLRRAASASSSTDGAAWPQVDTPSLRMSHS